VILAAASRASRRPASTLPLAITVLFALVSAFLIGFAEISRTAAWLSLIGTAPLIYALRHGGLLRVWFAIWLFAAAYSVGATWWLVQTGAGVGWMLLVMPLYLVLPVILPAVGIAILSSTVLRVIAFPFLWTATELLTRMIFLRLNWAIVGLPLADYPLLSQAAALFGPEAVSFVAASTGALLILLITLHGRERGWAALAAAAFVIALLGAGVLRTTAPDSGAKTFKIGLVQPAVPEDVIWTPQAREPFLGRMTNLIDSLWEDAPDVIVLPEGAVNGLVRYDKRLTDFVRSTVIRTHTPILFGSYDRQASQFYNVAIYIDPYNTVTTYRKIRLAPLIEYEPALLPYKRPSNWLRYTAGVERTVFSTVTGVRFSAMICLEDSLPDLAREFARSGAQLLFGLVSTQRYDGTSEHLQQLRRAQLVSISVGLPMVRCANSGISGSIDPFGHIEKSLPEGRPAAAVVDAQLLSLNTPYRITGDWPWFAAMLLVGFGIGLRSRFARTRDSR
jgi:apolipoprotein N-acyltransferase